MKNDPQELSQAVRGGNIRSLARVISLIEDKSPLSQKCIELLFPFSGKAHVIGITGPPGAGKSTLVDRLIEHFRRLNKKIGVLAVDPTSPFSGGALLGDRIRMNSGAKDPTVFIRSMATRGALGGIAPATAEGIHVLDAAGFELIIVETVGVGQAEIEIVRTCDTCVVVLVPGLGDGVQAMKAGILEIADVFVINKADHPGTELLKKDLLTMLSLVEPNQQKPAVVETIATDGSGIEELSQAIIHFHSLAKQTRKSEERKKMFLREALYRHISTKFLENVLSYAQSHKILAESLKRLYAREIDPHSLAAELIKATVIFLAKKETTITEKHHDQSS